MNVLVATLGTLLLAGSALMADDAVRSKLAGTWQQSDGNSAAKATWTLKDMGDSMHVTNSTATGVVVEFDCNTLGRECAVKHAGRKPSKVVLYFNGPTLIEMETTGSQVVKRRFAVTGDGDTLDLETIPLVPSGETEKTHFKRVPAPKE